jgi:hypothetical protein
MKDTPFRQWVEWGGKRQDATGAVTGRTPEEMALLATFAAVA